jgi:serine/threonine protein kinase
MEEDDAPVMSLGSVEGSSWMAKRSKNKDSKASGGLGLSIIPTEDVHSKCFNLSDSGSFREGLLHISQQVRCFLAPSCPAAAPAHAPALTTVTLQGATVHSARSLAASEPSERGTPALSATSPTSVRSTTSAKRANGSDLVTYTLEQSDFENMEVIGKGSSGYVRKAKRKSTNEVLALKVINVFDEEKRKQMSQEVIMMCDAHHESIITLHGAFYNEGTISVVLEYMTGGSVSDVLKMAKSIPERILRLMSEQILDGLAFMHARHQVHRDFKPCNLLLDHSGQVKITDLGVAAELDSSMVKCTTFVGTFLYMSPERFGSEPYSFPSDVWSFGLSMMECATGEYPFVRGGGDKTYWELMDAIVRNDPPSLSDAECSPSFNSFLKLCLHKEPKDRARVSTLLTHEFIRETCAGLAAAEKRAQIAAWLCSVRSAFTSNNLPASVTFKPQNVAMDFVNFYLASFRPSRRSVLWSLYTEASTLVVDEQQVVGQRAIQVHKFACAVCAYLSR